MAFTNITFYNNLDWDSGGHPQGFVQRVHYPSPQGNGFTFVDIQPGGTATIKNYPSAYQEQLLAHLASKGITTTPVKKGVHYSTS